LVLALDVVVDGHAELRAPIATAVVRDLDRLEDLVGAGTGAEGAHDAQVVVLPAQLHFAGRDLFELPDRVVGYAEAREVRPERGVSLARRLRAHVDWLAVFREPLVAG